MAKGHTALRVAAGENLAPFLSLLRQHRVPHRVYEASGEQVLEVASAPQAAEVAALYRAWRAGEFTLERQPVPAQQAARAGPDWRAAGVTLLLIVLSIAGFLLVYVGPLAWMEPFTFAPFSVQGRALHFGTMGHEYWRLVTPVFLHFGWLHIVFNSLWLWELGHRVERVLGHVHLLGLFLAVAIVSNGSQYLFSGPTIFGGMSGVVYGLLGFSWVGARLQPRWHFQPSRAIMALMLGWLLLCLAGVIEVLGFGAIANAAHVGGLLAGGVLGALLALLSRGGRDSSGPRQV